MLDDIALSALDWWETAGVDTPIDEAPRNWLAPTRIAAPMAEEPAPAPVVPALPGDLAAFRAWLLTDPVVPGPPAARLDASGDPASGTMILVDMPEAADRIARALLGGDAGALFDKMLAAMGLDRAGLYLAPFAPARPASGKLDAAQSATLARLVRHHIALVAPRRLLVLGDAASLALFGQPCLAARGEVRRFEHARGTVPSVASFHPRNLVQTPDRKAAAWVDLKLFMPL